MLKLTEGRGSATKNFTKKLYYKNNGVDNDFFNKMQIPSLRNTICASPFPLPIFLAYFSSLWLRLVLSFMWTAQNFVTGI